MSEGKATNVHGNQTTTDIYGTGNTVGIDNLRHDSSVHSIVDTSVHDSSVHDSSIHETTHADTGLDAHLGL